MPLQLYTYYVYSILDISSNFKFSTAGHGVGLQ